MSLVLLPYIWVREGATRTRAEEPHRYQRGLGHPARSVRWRVGSPQPSELGRDHPGGGSGALTLALPPPLPTEEITPTHTHLSRPSHDGPRRPLVRASSHHTWVTGEDDPKRGPLTTGRPAPLSPPRLKSLPSPHLSSLGRPVRPGSKARPPSAVAGLRGRVARAGAAHSRVGLPLTRQPPCPPIARPWRRRGPGEQREGTGSGEVPKATLTMKVQHAQSRGTAEERRGCQPMT